MKIVLTVKLLLSEGLPIARAFENFESLYVGEIPFVGITAERVKAMVDRVTHHGVIEPWDCFLLKYAAYVLLKGNVSKQKSIELNYAIDIFRKIDAEIRQCYKECAPMLELHRNYITEESGALVFQDHLTGEYEIREGAIDEPPDFSIEENF